MTTINASSQRQPEDAVASKAKATAPQAIVRASLLRLPPIKATIGVIPTNTPSPRARSDLSGQILRARNSEAITAISRSDKDHRRNQRSARAGSVTPLVSSHLRSKAGAT